MKQAIELARRNIARQQGGPFGAVVVYKDVIIGEGFNQVLANADPTAHAEIVAIRTACASIKSHMLNDCDIYTTCEPCPMCLAAIYWSRIRCVYYATGSDIASQIGFDDQLFYQELCSDHSERNINMQYYYQEDAEQVMRAWAGKKDKVIY